MEVEHMDRNKIPIWIILAGILLHGGLFSVPANAQDKKDSLFVNQPFDRMVSDNFTTGSIRTVSGEELEEMPAGDIRGRLTGQLPGFMAKEQHGAYWGADNWNTGVFSGNGWSYNLKGRNSPQLIVDDIRMPFTELLLDPAQIESITLISDVADMARLGAIASEGAIYIKTRKGAYNTPMKVVTYVESGIGMINLLPEWVDGFQYARLNNMARAASGYTQLYDPISMDGIIKNDKHNLIAPNVDYKGMMLKSWRPVLQESIRISGGGTAVNYSAALSALHSGDIVNADDISYNRINISSSLGTKLNRWLEINLNYNGSVNFNRRPYTAWNAYKSVPAVAFPIDFGSAVSDEEAELGLYGVTRYGVSKTFENNYYALLKEGGRQTIRRRAAHITAALNTDMGVLLPGLKSRTSFSYLSFLSTDIGKKNDYLAYYWDPAEERGYGQISTTHQGTKATSKNLLSSATNMALQFYERLYWDYANNGHKLNIGGTFLMYSAEGSGITYRQRQMLGVMDATWAYRGKYIVEAVGQYVGTHRFDKAHRFAFMPSFGVSWIASNEDFLKDVSFLDKLKLRVQWGQIGLSSSAFGTPYYYQSLYSFANSYSYGPYLSGDTWFGTNLWVSQATTIGRFENDDLGWPWERVVNIGVDLGLIKCLTLSAEFFSNRQKGVITDISAALPALYGLSGIETYANYNETDYSGWELTAGYHGKAGDYRYGLTISALSHKSKYRILADNVCTESYQDKIGKSTSAIWGYQCIGRYQNEEQLSLLPAFSSDVTIGDLYYKDKNGDGVVDPNDRTIIGDSNPDLRFYLNLNLGWKKLNLQLVGTGVIGGKLSLTNNYFWNGWGDGNYSAFVRDNIGGAYPRLSYVKSGNNFITSDFWLTDGTYFKIKDAILSYAFPKVTIYLKGQNLLTFTKVRYVDPENINSGVSDYPMFRTTTVGFKLTF